MMPVVASRPLPNVTPVDPPFHVLAQEWPRLSGAHPNVLLVGDRTATDAAVSDLQSTYQPPVVVRDCGSRPMTLPPLGSVNTLILRDAAALSPEDQQMLSDWLSSQEGRTQVVTTSSVALFPLVTSGAFLSTLYYRLNVIYAEVTASSEAIESAA